MVSDIATQIEELKAKQEQLVSEETNIVIETLKDFTETVEVVDGYEVSEELEEVLNKLRDVLGLNQDDTVTVKRTRVKNEEKDDIFRRIVEDAKKEHSGEEEWTLPYIEVGRRLAAYGHSPANMSVFFQSQLKGLPTTGKTSKKAIVFNKNGQ